VLQNITHKNIHVYNLRVIYHKFEDIYVCLYKIRKRENNWYIQYV
jgi:hypothetical protein